MVAIIPARGGSRGIKLKNLQIIDGHSLLGRAIRAAHAAHEVDEVVVSTDHPRIRYEAQQYGATAVDRPVELAGGRASSESAVLHALDDLALRGDSDPAVTVLVQCTSPIIDSQALDAACRRVAEGEADVAFAAVPNHNFLWTAGQHGGVTPLGHDAAHRPPRQEMAAQYRETGAFYAMNTAGLRACESRFFGRIHVQNVPEDTALEIDVPADLSMARSMLQRAEAPAAQRAASAGHPSAGSASEGPIRTTR